MMQNSAIFCPTRHYARRCLLASALVALAACGSGGVGDATGSTPSPTPRPTPIPSGSISGHLIYPAGIQPGEEIVAFRIDQSQPPRRVDTSADQTNYSLTLPAGVYNVLAYPLGVSGVTVVGAYTRAVLCGLDAACTDGTLLPVTVTAGGDLTSVDPTDWYNPQATWPRDPFSH